MASIARVRPPDGIFSEPMRTPLTLTLPAAVPAPADLQISFQASKLADGGGTREDTKSIWAFHADETTPAAWISCDGLSVVGSDKDALAFPGNGASESIGPNSVVAADVNFDFAMDLVLVGTRGIRMYIRSPISKSLVPAGKVPVEVVNTPMFGAWPLDIEADGDIDLIMAPKAGAPFVLRNNGDMTFAITRPFSQTKGLRALAWADADADGDVDIVMADDTGALILHQNQRAGRFLPIAISAPRKVAALTVMDADGDGTLDFISLSADGRVGTLRFSGSAWTSDMLGSWQGADSGPLQGQARLEAADMDNNGAVDLVLGSRTTIAVMMAGADRKPSAPRQVVQGWLCDVVDMTGDGKLDILSVNAGRPTLRANKSSLGYKWQQVRATGRKDHGDERTNSFGIGGEIEVRAGLLTQKRPILSPVIHFGLGRNMQVSIARFLWPNGAVQAEFDYKPSQVVQTQKRMGSSCPWVFAFNGREMEFVTDFIWRSPLGLRINAQSTGGVATTEDWVKIRGDQLAPRDGKYDIRVTAELWETHFFDHVSLMVVDHPADQEVWVDERFVFPPPKLKLIHTGELHAIAWATDDFGTDVTKTLATLDGQYLDTFGRGQYQGVTRDHFVEIDLGSTTVSADYLIASGWIHPTDSSINVAIDQGSSPKPQGLSLEVMMPSGAWRTADPNLGFPAGKTKTVVIPLKGLFSEKGPRRLRLRTNLEIFWDRIGWAEARDGAGSSVVRLQPQLADLQHRGYSVATQVNDSSPELPTYDRLSAVGKRWRDLEGYHTRFGDVRPLLSQVDDRYVIMNAGDEMRFTFAAPPLTQGMARDFVLVGDGWVKDGNLNTAFSKTVLPLPSHADTSYSVPPSALEADPVYRKNAADWRTFHTRYVDSLPVSRLPRTGAGGVHR